MCIYMNMYEQIYSPYVSSLICLYFMFSHYSWVSFRGLFSFKGLESVGKCWNDTFDETGHKLNQE